MPKNTIADYAKVAAQNTDIAGIDIDEGCSPAGINNAIRHMMADLADIYDGTVPLSSVSLAGGTVNGAAIDDTPIGQAIPAAGTFTQVNSTGAVIATGAGQFGDDVNITGDVTVAGNISSTGGISAATFTGDGSGLSNLFITGMIMLWSGSTSTIPAGWAICDGQNNTPDLRNRFVVGAGDSYPVGNTGGQNSITEVPAHSHSFSTTTNAGGGHNHTGTTSTVGDHQHHGWGENRSWVYGVTGSRNQQGSGAVDFDNYFYNTSPAGAHNHSFTTSTATNHTHAVTGNTDNFGVSSVDIRPLYYALAYIMKT